MLPTMIESPILPTTFQRTIGRYQGSESGPLLVCIGSIHGNEPAGAHALTRVIQKLEASKAPFRGELLALAGNLGALNQGCRFLERDLNRMWLPERVNELKSRSFENAQGPEDLEQQELLEMIESALKNRSGPATFLDLHTTSSEGAAFTLISDTLTNRKIAMAMDVPIILGLEESIEGTILNYINELGHAAIGFEAGQHQAPSSIKNHEAAVWTVLMALGCIEPEDIPDESPFDQTLTQARRGLPRVFELRYRHAIQPDHEFIMEPGFSNFHPVKKGQLLAKDRRGPVYAKESGRLFMPLYQKQGEDGFFLVREIKPFWLKVSERLRRIHLDSILRWLPGVHRHPTREDALIINTRIAHFFAIEVCHLLGFRHHSHEEGTLVVRRRKQTTS